MTRTGQRPEDEDRYTRQQLTPEQYLRMLQERTARPPVESARPPAGAADQSQGWRATTRTAETAADHYTPVPPGAPGDAEIAPPLPRDSATNAILTVLGSTASLVLLVVVIFGVILAVMLPGEGLHLMAAAAGLTAVAAVVLPLVWTWDYINVPGKKLWGYSLDRSQASRAAAFRTASLLLPLFPVIILALVMVEVFAEETWGFTPSDHLWCGLVVYALGLAIFAWFIASWRSRVHVYGYPAATA